MKYPLCSAKRVFLDPGSSIHILTQIQKAGNHITWDGLPALQCYAYGYDAKDFPLLVFPENEIVQNNTLNIVNVDCTSPIAGQVDISVFIRSSQISASREFRTIRENDF